MPSFLDQPESDFGGDQLSAARRRLFIFVCACIGVLGVATGLTSGAVLFREQPVRAVVSVLAPALIGLTPFAVDLQKPLVRPAALLSGALFAHLVITSTYPGGSLAASYLAAIPLLFGLLVGAWAGAGAALCCAAVISVLHPAHIPADVALTTTIICLGIGFCLFVFQREIEKATTALLSANRALVRAQSGQNQSNQILNQTLACLTQGVLVCDRDRRIVRWNARFLELLEAPVGWLKEPRGLADYFRLQAERGEYGPMRADEIEEKIVRRMRELEALLAKDRLTLTRRRPNGRYVQIHARPTPDGGLVATFQDVTGVESTREQLEARAVRDPLTGVFNRAGFDDHIEDAILRAQSGDLTAALLVIDLDHFKPVNDRLGHAAGDEVLRQVARRIQERAGADGAAYRLGGDEFAVTVPVRHTDDAAKIASRLSAEIRAPISFEGRSVIIGASIGAAVVGPAASSAKQLMRDADAALYDVKRGGRGGVRIVVCGDAEATVEDGRSAA